jgi:hypothetical protein
VRAQHAARVIAANNILNAAFMVVSAGGEPAAVQAPGSTFRNCSWRRRCSTPWSRSTSTPGAGIPDALHRVDADPHGVPAADRKGLERIPDDGGALIVCNHVSFVDALVITAACRRPIRFVMDHRILPHAVLISFVFRTNRDSDRIGQGRRGDDGTAFDESHARSQRGNWSASFPKGRITDTGELYPFKPGVSASSGARRCR